MKPVVKPAVMADLSYFL